MKRTRIPEDFQVSSRIVVLAKERGWPSPQSELEAFKDYHLAHGTLMLNWEAAFRTWLRNCNRFANKYTLSKPQQPQPDIKRRLLPEMSEEERQANQRRLQEMISTLAAQKAAERRR